MENICCQVEEMNFLSILGDAKKCSHKADKPTSMTYLQLVRNWVISNGRDNISALYALDSKIVKHLKLNNYHNTMKSFISIVVKFLKAKDCWIENPSDWDIMSIYKMWATINTEFIDKYCQSIRKKEMTRKTTYNNMSNQMHLEILKNKLSRVMA